jgi:hypothetical protein
MPVSAESRSRNPNKIRPFFFSYENCFENLLNTINKSRFRSNVKLTVLFDGTVEELSTDFLVKYYDDSIFKIICIDAKSDEKSSKHARHFAKSLNLADDDIIYFLENDYLHTYDWIEKVLDVFSNKNIQYVSLYDHKDKYILHMYSELNSKIILSSTHHWRTTPSTCGSFLLSVKLFNNDFDMLESGLPDFHLFKFLGDNGRFLISPIPGLSTHCMDGYLSPNIDWNSISLND